MGERQISEIEERKLCEEGKSKISNKKIEMHAIE